VVCGQLFRNKHLAIQHCVGESYFLQLIGGGVVMPSTNEEDLNSYCDSCVGITKMEIVLHELCISTCVCWVVLVVY